MSKYADHLLCTGPVSRLSSLNDIKPIVSLQSGQHHPCFPGGRSRTRGLGTGHNCTCTRVICFQVSDPKALARKLCPQCQEHSSYPLKSGDPIKHDWARPPLHLPGTGPPCTVGQVGHCTVTTCRKSGARKPAHALHSG